MPVKDAANTAEILHKIKSAILNIDWEISDENIATLNQEIAALRSVWQGKKLHMIYLQILGALSQYIAGTKQQGNPAAFSMLRAAFDRLEEMVTNPGDEEQDRQKVMEHVDAYNALKQSLAGGKTTPTPSRPEPEPVPATAPEPASEPEPEPEVVAVAAAGEAAFEEPRSPIHRLLDDKEDHTTDFIFDSMLDEMVPAEPAGQALQTPPPAAPTPKAPAGRPAVQAAYNKDDGTEIEADRTLDEEFAEADALLDNFFEDDVPPPGSLAKKASAAFDLSVLDEEEGPALDLDQAAAHDDKEVDEFTAASQPSPVETGVSPELEHVEDSELDIFKIEDEAAPTEPPAVSESIDFTQMESALDDFFAEEEELAPASPATVVKAPAPDDAGHQEVDAALDDFFDDEEIPAAAMPIEDLGGGDVAALKALLLSVDFEVDDQLLDRVDAEIDALAETLAANDVALMHLHFLKTIMHHVGRAQSQVISESMACLKMVTESLEDLLAGEGMDEARYAAQAAAAFVDWHELVVAAYEKRLDAAQSQGSDLAESIEVLALAGTEGETAETRSLKNEILSEVREILSREMQAIRRELAGKD